MHVHREGASPQNIPAARVLWEAEAPPDGKGRSARYRVVQTPTAFQLERGHVDAMSHWSWNTTGTNVTFRVFQQIMADYTRLAGGEGGGS